MAYKSALVFWLHEHPSVPLPTKLGPIVCSDIRQVTAASFASVQSVVSRLLTSGLRNATMQSWKLHEACRQVLLENPHWVSAELPMAKQIDDMCKHLQCIFRLLRECKFEEAHFDGIRRHPRTGGFRRRISKAGLDDLLENALSLMDPIDNPCCDSPPSSHPPPARPASDWPSFCCPASCASLPPRALALPPPPLPPAAAAVPSAAPNDDDGAWPAVFSQQSKLASADASLDHQIVPILPNPRRRKVVAQKQAIPKKRQHEELSNSHFLRFFISSSSERFEVTAKTASCKRVHVYPLYGKRFGDKLATTGNKMIQEIVSKDLDREGVQLLRQKYLEQP